MFAPNIFAANTGENTNADNVAGVIVFFKKLVSPNRNPKNAPCFGPQNKAPIMTGI